MIQDIPTPEEFNEVGLNLIHASWEQVFDLFTEFDDISYTIEMQEEPSVAEESARYWEAAKQSLTRSYAMVHQAVEFFLKGRISEVSPYLLIGGSPSGWPSRCDSEDKSFSDFRVINSEDLVKVANTVHRNKLSDDFRLWFHELRTNRNKIMHTVEKRLNFTPEDLIPVILEACEFFVGERAFCKSHMAYLERTPLYNVQAMREEGYPYLLERMHRHVKAALDRLSPAQTQKYFGFDKRRASCCCPSCHEMFAYMDTYDPDSMDGQPQTYQEKGKGQKNYYCFVCGYEGTFIDYPCDSEYCDGNRLDKETRRCLLCGDEST
ncbi:MAG: hypothetical protein KDD60_12820 [Bdellovibrionales bacterium]|nr:hypothetical protein [Bdellovibrionales bacterium]